MKCTDCGVSTTTLKEDGKGAEIIQPEFCPVCGVKT